MKKRIWIAVLAVLAALVAWCIVMDPVSVQRDKVASIQLVHYDSYFDETKIVTISDENQIHYITDLLNGLLPIPRQQEYSSFYYELTFLDSRGSMLCTVRLHDNKTVITDRGTFYADVGELNGNLSRILAGEKIVNSLSALWMYMILWLLVGILGGLLCLFGFLSEMVVCTKTGSIFLRLIPAVIFLWIAILFHYVIYIVPILGIDAWNMTHAVVIAAVVLCLILGWRQGSKARQAATTC